MNQQTTQLQGCQAVATAHRDPAKSLLLITLTADESEQAPKRVPMKVALVIDRSGSMSGDKLNITKAAVAQFIRSLAEDDRVAVITYDDRVDLFGELQAPSEQLAARVEAIQSGGSTNLYGGWVAGAKLVGAGGRVILLSDGLANVGRYTGAADLSYHAETSYKRYQVTTTTIGVGRDYDEALMAGMARQGGGAHYFAHEASAISAAFSQERYSADAIVLEGVSVQCGSQTIDYGHFWAGEEKGRVFELGSLTGLTASVRYTNRAQGGAHTQEIALPTEFGYSEDVRLQYLLQLAAEAEAEMVGVRDPNSAARMRARIRSIVLDLLNHPSSDRPEVAAVIDRLKASVDRLEQLERNYVEEDAILHRKRSMQSSHNLRESAKSYTSFEDEREAVMHMAASSSRIVEADFVFAPEAAALAPIQQWIDWCALPYEVSGTLVKVAMEDPRNGFLIAEIEKRIGRRVRATFAGMGTSELIRLIRLGDQA